MIDPMARAVDVVLSDRLVGRWRSRLCSGARGVVLDLGFGSGRNLEHFGPEVTEVLAVDPSDSGWELAQQRIAKVPYPVRRAGIDAASIDIADDSVDTVTTAWTMCTIPELGAALAEVGRVLRPGGELRFVEHSLAPHSRVQRFQRFIQPLWGRFSGGCHVDRNILQLLADAGFSVYEVNRRYAFPGIPLKPWAWFVTGRASFEPPA
ncbi:MAG: SAM-dependent methyltransferase [Arachnia propionica]|nr:MAG: SAM-dependent methyltransferase [Arachnia propionica]